MERGKCGQSKEIKIILKKGDLSWISRKPDTLNRYSEGEREHMEEINKQT